MREKMFRPGRKITSMAILDRELSAGNYIMINSKPFHPGWTQSMQYRLLKEYVTRGCARIAIKNNKGEESGNSI